MSNSISFIGNCTTDAKVKNVNGNSVLEVTVANNVGYGEKQSTNWIRVSYWKNAEKLANYLVKGQPVFVSGELTSNEYTTQDGRTKMQLSVRANNMDFVGKKSTESESNIKVHNPPAMDYDYDDMPF